MLRGLSVRAIKELDLVRALEAEARAPNSVLPSQPGLTRLAASRDRRRFTEWLASELQSGLAVSLQVVVNARKPRHGTRPAPIMSIPERIAYRAIVDRLPHEEEPLARAKEQYLGFIRGPVDHVLHKASGHRTLGWLLHDDEIQYVVKSDLAAFYEYIDHGILGRLLVARSRDADLVQSLMEFLGELEGRSYGVPQMFEASDRLSEVYGQLIQDQLARRGALVWRFNDDFRIGVPSFEDALDALEALSEEARSVGMIINEQKTTSPRFATYAMTTFGLDSVNDEIPLSDEGEVEAGVADYTEMFGDPEEAASMLDRAVTGEADWDLRDLNRDQVARLRRAIWSVARAKDDGALSSLRPLAIYVPSLTPVLCRYAETLSEERLEAVASAVDSVVTGVSLGGWQRLWFSHLLRTAKLLDEQGPADVRGRVAFAEACASDSRHPATRAEAMLALAPTGRVTVQGLAESLVTEPRALSSWYVVAAGEAAATDRDEKVLRGIRGLDPLNAMLLDARR